MLLSLPPSPLALPRAVPGALVDPPTVRPVQHSVSFHMAVELQNKPANLKSVL